MGRMTLANIHGVIGLSRDACLAMKATALHIAHLALPPSPSTTAGQHTP